MTASSSGGGGGSVTPIVTVDTDFGEYNLSDTNLDALLPTGHNLSAGNYSIAKVTSDNGTPGNSDDDVTTYQLQAVEYNAGSSTWNFVSGFFTNRVS